jgi:hypothetical protein
MARRKAARGGKKAKGRGKRAPARRSTKRSSRAAAPRRAASRSPKQRSATKRTRTRKGRRKTPSSAARATPPALARERRTLDETLLSPPSSLDMNRRGSAARTGRAEIAESRQDHASMTPAITAGDVDADVENAYFSGEEAPGGDTPTPDQDIVDDIGRAIGIEYQDNEPLRSSDKVAERDKHRWELDPASSEDYKDRK